MKESIRESSRLPKQLSAADYKVRPRLQDLIKSNDLKIPLQEALAEVNGKFIKPYEIVVSHKEIKLVPDNVVHHITTSALTALKGKKRALSRQAELYLQRVVGILDRKLKNQKWVNAPTEEKI